MALVTSTADTIGVLCSVRYAIFVQFILQLYKSLLSSPLVSISDFAGKKLKWQASWKFHPASNSVEQYLSHSHSTIEKWPSCLASGAGLEQ